MANSAYLSLFSLEVGTHFVTRVTPMHYIDCKGHKLELRCKRKYFNQICRVQIIPLVIYSLRGEHTHTNKHIHIRMKVILRNQVHAGLQPGCAWFIALSFILMYVFNRFLEHFYWCLELLQFVMLVILNQSMVLNH